MVSRRTRWWLLAAGPAAPFAVFGVLALALHRELALAIIAFGSAATIVVRAWGSVALYQAGFHRGRLDGLLAARDASMGAPREIPEDPAPWDPPITLEEIFGVTRDVNP